MAVVLDAGAGTGFFLDRWSEAGARELWGLDCSGEAIRRLRTSHPQVRLMQADLGEPSPGIADAAFDAVSCIDTLVHIVDESACRMALANFARWLRPGGHLLLSENFLRRGERRHADYWCSRSLAFYQRELAALGLEILERRPLLVLMNAPVDAALPGAERIWRRCLRPAHLEWFGALAGAALYPFEVALTAWLPGSPSSELLLCRKR